VTEWEPRDRLVLALPDDYEVPAGSLAPTMVPWATKQRDIIRAEGNIDQAVELTKRLAAFQRYVDDRQGRDDLAAEERRTEVLIGQFLGRAPGRGRDEETARGLLERQRCREFRLMAEHEDWVEQWLTREDRVVSRRQLLDMIDRRLARRPAGDEATEAEAETQWYRVLEGDCFSFDAEFSADPVDFIITDAPYIADVGAIDLCERLAQHAPRWLKPDGSLLLMMGQMYLPEVVRRVAPHLHYRWTLAYLTPGGQAVQIWPHQVNTFWKPVFWFTNGGGRYRGGWRGDASTGEGEWLAAMGSDLTASTENDKRDHAWGQSEGGMVDLLDRFVSPGETVLDPFMGAGTTGVAALRLGCRFLGVDIKAENVRIAAERLAQECDGAGAAGAGGADGLAGSGVE